MQQQTFYSVLDQVYHGPIPLPGPSTTSVLAHLQEQYSCVPYVPNTVSLFFYYVVCVCQAFFTLMCTHLQQCDYFARLSSIANIILCNLFAWR